MEVIIELQESIFSAWLGRKIKLQDAEEWTEAEEVETVRSCCSQNFGLQ